MSGLPHPDERPAGATGMRARRHAGSARSGPVRELRGALAAVCFLTRLPLGAVVTLDGDDVRRSAVAFPVVGAAIGVGVGGLAAALSGSLTTLLAVALALTAGTVLTGALHLDALADSADALGAHTRERALAIMRDSRIGSFGTSAIALDLLIKAAALAALVRDERVVRYAVAAGALARAVPVLLAAALPYARSSDGSAVALTLGGGLRAAAGGIVAGGIAVAVAGADGAVLVGAATALALVCGAGLHRWLGGVTGDGLGAALELTETSLLVVAVALVGGR